MKECRYCHVVKPRTEFQKRSEAPDGLQYRCKQCMTAYHQANKEVRIARVNAWQKANPEKTRANKTKWKRTHTDAVNAGTMRRRYCLQMTEASKVKTAKWRAAHRTDDCFYCGKLGEQWDHVFPLSKGGTDHWFNLVRACVKCNQKKSNKLASQWVMASAH